MRRALLVGALALTAGGAAWAARASAPVSTSLEARRHADARADHLVAALQDELARVRAEEEARVGGLCVALARAGDPPALDELLALAVAGTRLHQIGVLETLATGEIRHRAGWLRPDLDESRRIAFEWDALGSAVGLARAGATVGLEDGRAPLRPLLPLAAGTARAACGARTEAGRHFHVVAFAEHAELALPAMVADGARVERVAAGDPAPDEHVRRWLTPDPERPTDARVALLVPVARVPAAAPTALVVAATAALGAAIGLVLALVLGRGRTAVPSAELAKAAERVAKGDLDVTLSGAEGDATVSAFNRMTRELREARARATRTERVAAWRETARRVAHEVKNPLTPIRMAIETLRKARARHHPDEPEIFEESTRAVLEEVNRLERIVSDFGKFAKLPRPRVEEVDLRELCAHVVSLAGLPSDVTATDGAQRTEVTLLERGPAPVRADREQIAQVLTNLVHNAMDAARAAHGGGGHVRVTLASVGAGARIAVEDDGPGIPAEDRERVLEPYFTTKPTGTGLGLAIVDRIVSEHEGTLVFERSESLGGAAVIVTLRREGPTESAESSRPSTP